ncbi:hypothetical protein ACA910_003369 [Epithemia clementina (nom. ined.)]
METKTTATKRMTSKERKLKETLKDAQGAVAAEPEAEDAPVDEANRDAVMDAEVVDIAAKKIEEEESVFGEEEGIAVPNAEESENEDAVYSHAQQLSFAY